MRKQATLLMLILLIVGATSGVMSVRAQDADFNPQIDPADFVEGVDNPFFPLVPQTTYIYEGTSDGVTERIVVQVTNQTREVMGVTTTVVRDRVWEDGELVEDTYDWYAQDVDGNVWYFGEDSSEIEDGEVINKDGSWEAGVDGALPGIIMWADPEVGASYRQEYYAGEAEDMAEVLSLNAAESVAMGDFDALLQTNEWTPLEPGIAEHKFYAEGIGVVLELKVAGGEGRIELIDMMEDDDFDDDDMADDDEDEDDDDDDDDDDDC